MSFCADGASLPSFTVGSHGNGACGTGATVTTFSSLVSESSFWIDSRFMNAIEVARNRMVERTRLPLLFLVMFGMTVYDARSSAPLIC